MKTSRRDWSLIGLIAAEFTIISAGIGLIQARLAADAIIYSNFANIRNQTSLFAANVRIEQQTSLFYPLGMFLVTLGLAMLFSTALRVGLSMRKTADEKQWGTNVTRARLTQLLRGFFLVPVRLSQLQGNLTRVPGKLIGLLRRLIQFLGWGNIMLIILAGTLAVGAYGLSLQIRQAVGNIWRVLITHQSFGVGFAVLFIIFLVVLDIAFRTKADDYPIQTDRVEKRLTEL